MRAGSPCIRTAFAVLLVLTFIAWIRHQLLRASCVLLNHYIVSWFLVTIAAFRASAVFVWRLPSIYISESETHGICGRFSQVQSSTRECPWRYQSKVVAIIGASRLRSKAHFTLVAPSAKSLQSAYFAL